MLRAPAVRANVTRKQRLAKVGQMPAPVGGWNARDALPAMPKTDAVRLDNVIPQLNGCALRRGYAAWTTGLGTYVESLMTYNAPLAANNKMFAAAGTSIYDATASGAIGAAVVSGLSSAATSARWQHVVFSTAGSNYLVLANGVDSVREYDGVSWTTPAITGPTSTADLIQVWTHMRRLWFVEKSTMSIWYLPVESISGAATEIDLGPLCSLGGEVWAGASWSRDGGNGLEDLLCVVTSKGELFVYSGTDPADATTWQIVGRYTVPVPIGRRCWVKTGADLGLLTVQGLIPISSVLPLSLSAQGRSAATDKISGAYASVYAVSGQEFGWSVIEFPTDQILIVNVPIEERVTQYQYVMHTRSGSWCRFTGLNAGCWAVMNDELFFGGNDGTVYHYTGEDDNTAAIEGTIITAFDNFKSPALKMVNLVKPLLFGAQNYEPSISAIYDFDSNVVSYNPGDYTAVGPAWNEVYWDQEYWGYEGVASAVWESTLDIGVFVALAIAISSTTNIIYNGSLINYETGDIF